MRHPNNVTIDEMRFLFHGAKQSKQLLDNAIAQVLLETSTRVVDLDVKRTLNLYVMNHGSCFSALIELINSHVIGVFPISLPDYAIIQVLVQKIASIDQLYAGLLVAVPKEGGVSR